MKNVTGDKYRVFISPALGCESSCTYCYLPDLGLITGSQVADIASKDDLIEQATQIDGFTTGVFGTIISLGCYTEAWSPRLKPVTISCISHFLDLGNPVQVATKQVVSNEDVQQLFGHIRWRGQLSFYISCPSISYWHDLEKNVPSPTKRLEALEFQRELDIPFYLYIKPYIHHTTDKDLTLFAKVMGDYNVGAIVGAAFCTERTKDAASVGGGRLFLDASSNLLRFTDSLRERGGTVLTTSVNAVEMWRLKLT